MQIEQVRRIRTITAGWKARSQSLSGTGLRGYHPLGEIQLLVDLDWQMVGINEFPQALAGESEESGVCVAGSRCSSMTTPAK